MQVGTDAHGALPTWAKMAVSIQEQLLLETSTGLVLTGLSRDLQIEPFPHTEYNRAEVVPVLVCERHFLRSYDDQICEFANGFPSRSKVIFHLSLDDAMLRPFVGAHVIGMLRQLGMTEENSIDGGLLGRQLLRSQKKLAAKLRDLRDASSPEEWLERNRLE